jgi:GNAT superfamily N-acetyltransferase
VQKSSILLGCRSEHLRNIFHKRLTPFSGVMLAPAMGQPTKVGVEKIFLKWGVFLRNSNMELRYNGFLLSDDKSLIQIDRVYELLKKSYWAEKWITREIVILSVENSFCFGIYKDAVLIGFARCITDYSTMYYLADFVIDDSFKGQGLGKVLAEFITEHEIFSPLLGVLETKDAHGLYEKFGFQTSKGFAMRKDPF